MLKAAALSLVGLVSEEEAPRPRLGSRSSAPRPIAMTRLLDRLAQQRKRFTCLSPHVIHIVRRATRLTSSAFQFSAAFDTHLIDDAAQYLALARPCIAIKPNRMEFAQLPTKLSCSSDVKKIFVIFFGASRKNKTPLDRAAFISS